MVVATPDYFWICNNHLIFDGESGHPFLCPEDPCGPDILCSPCTTWQGDIPFRRARKYLKLDYNGFGPGTCDPTYSQNPNGLVKWDQPTSCMAKCNEMNNRTWPLRNRYVGNEYYPPYENCQWCITHDVCEFDDQTLQGFITPGFYDSEIGVARSDYWGTTCLRFEQVHFNSPLVGFYIQATLELLGRDFNFKWKKPIANAWKDWNPPMYSNTPQVNYLGDDYLTENGYSPGDACCGDLEDNVTFDSGDDFEAYYKYRRIYTHDDPDAPEYWDGYLYYPPSSFIGFSCPCATGWSGSVSAYEPGPFLAEQWKVKTETLPGSSITANITGWGECADPP